MSGTTLNHKYLHYRSLIRIKEKGSDKVFEQIIAENVPNMG